MKQIKHVQKTTKILNDERMGGTRSHLMMSRRENKLLQKKNVCEECFGSEEDENEVIQNEGGIEILESDETMQEGESSDSEKENQQKLGLRRKSMRILSDAESEN
uniref:Uncharacterized protein n=1 Tax=Glossina pallidipes TaxID=7398 RepID=A0A1A9ZA79_GLOPL